MWLDGRPLEGADIETAGVLRSQFRHTNAANHQGASQSEYQCQRVKYVAREGNPAKPHVLANRPERRRYVSGQ